MANAVTLTFAGESKSLKRAAAESSTAIEGVGASATTAGREMQESGQQTAGYVDRVGKLGAAVEGATTAFESIGGAMTAVVDIQNASRERAMRLARAQADVEQAMLDGTQAAIDLEQATLDLGQSQTDSKQYAQDARQAQIDQKQALIDAKTATDDYNTAVKEHGKDSVEAQQALVDLEQARADETQAAIDGEQAQRDATQAAIDGKQAVNDQAQAVRDGKDSQLDLNDAMHAANPSGLQKWSENINMVTPLLSALVGVVGLVTAAQWAWNIAMTANPIGLIIAAGVAVIGIIVLIATKTDWFQRLWKNAWGGIKDAALAVGRWFRDTLWGKWIRGAWDAIQGAGQRVWAWMRALPGRLRSAFASVAGFLFQPFRTAFNRIASAWNNTIGRLSWTIPGWVPGVGGNSISAPRLPHFHSGGAVPGIPGSEVLAVLQAGEKVVSRGGNDGATQIIFGSDGSRVGDAILEIVRIALDAKGGRPGQIGLRPTR